MTEVEKRQLETIEYYGPMNQLKYMQTEIFELNEAIILYENGIGSIEHVIEEMGDTLNMLKQFILLYEIKKEELDNVEDFKTFRQIGRIKQEKKSC